MYGFGVREQSMDLKEIITFAKGEKPKVTLAKGHRGFGQR
jgi:hypothetical protein